MAPAICCEPNGLIGRGSRERVDSKEPPRVQYDVKPRTGSDGCRCVGHSAVGWWLTVRESTLCAAASRHVMSGMEIAFECRTGRITGPRRALRLEVY